jgi:hypothetical protein
VRKNRVVQVKKRLNLCLVRLAVLCWLLAPALPCLWAGGKQQDPALTRADELIAEKRYDEAILILSGYSRDNPLEFDAAQRRLRQIYRIRGNFNNTADELLDVLQHDPDNAPRILALTRRLEELEDSANPQLRIFISRTRELALFNVNRRRLEDILVRGREQIDQKDYGGALRTYAGGMDIYRDEFFAASYGEDLESQVLQTETSVNGVLGAFPAISAPLGTAASQMASAVPLPDTTLANMQELYERMIPTLENFANLQYTLYGALDSFSSQLEELHAVDSSLGDRNFISFMSRLISGRSGESLQEGMLGALEGYWNDAVGTVDDAIMRHADNMYASGIAASNELEYAAARGFFEEAAEYTNFPAELYARRRELKSGRNPPILVLFDKPVLREDSGNFLKYESLNESVAYLVQGTDLGSRIAQSRNPDSALARWREEQIDTAEALRLEQGTRNSYGMLQSEVETLLLAANQKETELRNYQSSLADTAGVNILSYIDDAKTIITALRSLTVEESRKSAERYYTIANGDFGRRLENRRTELAEGRSLLQGINREGPENSSVEHYPTEALAELNRMAGALAEDTSRGNALLVEYTGEPAEILASPAVSFLQREVQEMMNELSRLGVQGSSFSATARNQIAQAEAYRIEGERLLREAQAALGRQAFDTARERVDRAEERFNSSLAIQESAALRATRDTQLVRLSQDINRIENDMVIRDVRNLVENARGAYFAGNFDQAEDMLVRAQNRWRVTNAGDDPEVIYWLGMIRGALSLRSGREILPTAPLYPEMSQLLSEAKKDYDEGLRYLNTGRRGEGIAKFNDARQKTREVKLMFPMNQEAGILDLMMERITDTPAFDAAFEQRIRDAVSKTKQKNLEAFAELQNLAKINPRYPNINAILFQAEIDMGIRPPPPNPRDIARSRELTESARRILEGNITTQFEVAMTQINQAITLNINNTEAPRIKDQLNYRMANPGSNVLNSQDEAKYQLAVQEYQRGNNFVALSIVQEILQNTRNRNITKVLDLERRIRSQL